MLIQKISNLNVYNKFLCPKSNDEDVRCSAVVEPLPEDMYVPSFGNVKKAISHKVLPLIIPKDMFTSSAQARKFSQCVEAMRTIDAKNCTQERYKRVAKILFDEEDCFSTYAQVKEFVEANAPEFKSGERNFEDVFDYFAQALASEKIPKNPVVDEKVGKLLTKAAEKFGQYGYFPNSIRYSNLP